MQPMSDVREQSKSTEERIHLHIEQVITALVGMLRDREAVLVSDVETIRHQKEKELQLQKDELEFLLGGIRHAILFGEAMMKHGSETEIVASHQQVVARMVTLTSEREKAQLEPTAEANEIEFVPGENLVFIHVIDIAIHHICRDLFFSESFGNIQYFICAHIAPPALLIA